VRYLISVEELERLHQSGSDLAKRLWSVEGGHPIRLQYPRLRGILAIPVQHPYDGHKGWFGEHPNRTINICIPVQGASTAPHGWFNERSARVTGVLSHELIHIKQKFCNRSTYQRDMNHLQSVDHLPKTPDFYVKHYYSLWSEQEAHAVQLATEMWFTKRRFEQTFCWKHILWRANRMPPRHLKMALKREVEARLISWLAEAYSGRM
jgi:hypothetical protein